jgi:hypothetical protein
MPRRNNFSNSKQEWIQTKKGGKILTKSTWEKTFALILDEDKNVLNFQYEPLAIRYNYKGGKRNYYPDFLVRMKNGDIFLYEIKPKNLVNLSKNKPKAAAGRRFCRKMGWEYAIITEEKLFD